MAHINIPQWDKKSIDIKPNICSNDIHVYNVKVKQIPFEFRFYAFTLTYEHHKLFSNIKYALVNQCDNVVAIIPHTVKQKHKQKGVWSNMYHVIFYGSDHQATHEHETSKEQVMY